MSQKSRSCWPGHHPRRNQPKVASCLCISLRKDAYHMNDLHVRFLIWWYVLLPVQTHRAEDMSGLIGLCMCTATDGTFVKDLIFVNDCGFPLQQAHDGLQGSWTFRWMITARSNLSCNRHQLTLWCILRDRGQTKCTRFASTVQAKKFWTNSDL